MAQTANPRLRSGTGSALRHRCGSGCPPAVPALGTLTAETETMNEPMKRFAAPNEQPPPGHRVCHKTGRVLKQQREGNWLAWVFSAMGLASLVWFLVRVIPKPSRAAYPCQRAAFPLASSFVLWVTALVGSALAWRKFRRWDVRFWPACLWGGRDPLVARQSAPPLVESQGRKECQTRGSAASNARKRLPTCTFGRRRGWWAVTIVGRRWGWLKTWQLV